MAAPLQATERQNAFFHSLSKAATNSTQYVFESKYKSAHSVKGSEIWADTIAYCANSAAADAEATANTAVEKYTQVALTEIPGSNGQAWYINNAGTFVRPWISPVDVPNSTTNDPSDGFQANLYTSTGTLVTPTAGVWFVDYYAGIVHFEVGSTPANLGYGTPKITCYVYTGAYGAGTSSGGTLTGLTDVPDSYATHAGKYLVVKNTEDGIEFVAAGISGNTRVFVSETALAPLVAGEPTIDEIETFTVNSSHINTLLYYTGTAASTDAIKYVYWVDNAGNATMIDGKQLPAEDIVYDNTTSLLTATDVQSAIDELEAEKENELGSPLVDGYLLSSLVDGTRSWVAPVSTLNSLTDVVVTTPTNGQTLVYNGAEWVNQTATAASISELERTVTKTAHGLVVGDWITGTYAKGNATTLANSEVIGVVTEVVNANTFKYQSRGFTSKVTSLLPAGTLLLLQDNGSTSNVEAAVHKEVATVVDGGLEIDIKISIVCDGATVTAAVIDDTQTLVGKTWSSNKLSTMVIPIGGTTGQVLAKTSATNYAVGWTTVATSLASLTDATITSPTSGQYLTYNGTKWVNTTVTPSTALSTLTDVQLTTPTAGQYLSYNGTKWVNSTFVWTTANDVEITNATKGVILKSANGTRYRITVDNDGSLITTEVV